MCSIYNGKLATGETGKALSVTIGCKGRDETEYMCTGTGQVSVMIGLKYSEAEYCSVVHYAELVQHRTARYSTMQCTVMQCKAIQYSAVQ